jgi:hypothetical protein
VPALALSFAGGALPAKEIRRAGTHQGESRRERGDMRQDPDPEPSMQVLTAMFLLGTVGPAAGTAALEGSPEAVTDVGGALAQRGIALAARADEAALRARVEPTRAGLRLELRDREGRFAEREVATPALAAAVIESWLRTDIAGPLLAARPVLGAASQETTTAPAAASAAGAAGPGALSVAIAGETAVGVDRSLWLGASAAGCVRAGPLCVGLLVSIAHDTGATGPPRPLYKEEDQGTLQRLGADGMVTVGWPMRLGPVVLTPGLAGGVAWLSSRASFRDDKDGEEHDGEATRVGPVFEARAILSLPVARALAIDLGIGAKLCPTAHREELEEDKFTIPGEPLGYLRAGIGLRYGHP